jgi:hypothetical protein
LPRQTEGEDGADQNEYDGKKVCESRGAVGALQNEVKREQYQEDAGERLRSSSVI